MVLFLGAWVDSHFNETEWRYTTPADEEPVTRPLTWNTDLSIAGFTMIPAYRCSLASRSGVLEFGWSHHWDWKQEEANFPENGFSSPFGLDYERNAVQLRQYFFLRPRFSYFSARIWCIGGCQMLGNVDWLTFGVRYWLLMLLSAVPLTWALVPEIRGYRRRRRGACVRCGYSRAGLGVEAKCPECGSGELKGKGS